MLRINQYKYKCLQRKESFENLLDKITPYKKEDIDWFHYVKGIMDNVGSPAEIISPNEIKNIHPFIKI